MSSSFLSQMNKMLTVFFVVCLSGCSTLFNSGFECSKVGGKKGCVSLSEVNQSAENIAKDAEKKPTSPTKKPTTAVGFTGTPISIPEVGMPVRIGEHIQKIMLFDYIDTSGNYHEPGFVYTVLNQSKWQNHPVKAIQTMDEV